MDKRALLSQLIYVIFDLVIIRYNCSISRLKTTLKDYFGCLQSFLLISYSKGKIV